MGIYRGRDDHPETTVLYHDEYRRHESCWRVAPDLCEAGAEGAFVDAAYADFLGRAPTGEERAAAIAAVGADGRRSVVASLARSPEWSTFIVEELYDSTLGRPGDPDGVAFWAERIRSGALQVSSVAARFYASAEYRGRFPDVGAWVDDLYGELLERPSDAAGRAHWVDLASSAGPTVVALRFFQSAESARERVDRLYRGLLDRPADQAGLEFWAPRVVARGDIVLAIDLASSGEYFAKAQTQ
jgi:hypothetical protein